MSTQIKFSHNWKLATITKTGTCKVTGELYSVTAPMALWDRWVGEGELIQNVFPDMSADDREFLMTGTTPAEWDKLTGEENLPDEDEGSKYADLAGRQSYDEEDAF